MRRELLDSRPAVRNRTIKASKIEMGTRYVGCRFTKSPKAVWLAPRGCEFIDCKFDPSVSLGGGVRRCLFERCTLGKPNAPMQVPELATCTLIDCRLYLKDTAITYCAFGASTIRNRSDTTMLYCDLVWCDLAPQVFQKNCSESNVYSLGDGAKLLRQDVRRCDYLFEDGLVARKCYIEDTASTDDVDWRPSEAVPEDFYSSNRR